ncbi:RHS repeat-associated core domain-containing protein [Nonomuraea muscovyensis]|uniref:RHS repeat-associated core domain-containing protein n=1 Tax=Nonomuraea muscovyensis TaxID=1124761 RepID=UPI0033C36DAA
MCAPVAAPNCTTYTYADGSRYRATVLDSEPVGYFPLGDGQYDPPSNLGSDGRSGQYNDVAIGQPGALEGSTDTAAGFTTSSVMLPSNILARLRDRVSIEAWFKTKQHGMIFSASNSGFAGPALYVGTDGRLRGQLGEIWNGSAWTYTPIASPAAVTDDRWHHVVLNVADGKQKLFLDGQPVGEVSGRLDSEYRESAYLGGSYRANSWGDIPGGPNITGTWSFVGSMDEFALYNKPLSEAEIQAHFEAKAKVSNKLAKITLPSGRVWASNTYDAATDRLKTHTDRHGGTWQIGKPDSDWTETVATVTVTDPRNGTLTYGYDEWRGSRLVYQDDQSQRRTRYEYDTGGFLATVTDPNGNASLFYNDKRGNSISAQTCRSAGNCQFAYAEYYLNKDDEFDPRNDRMLVRRDARSSSSTDNTFATRWEYNQYGEQTKETSPATSDFPTGRSTGVSYTDGTEAAIGGGTTPAGLPASKTDARGNAWTYRYTASGDLAEQTDPEGLVTKLDYDTLGRLTTSAQVSDAHPDGVKTTFTYDGLSRPVKQTEPGVKNEITNVTHTKRTTFAYDGDGNKLSEKISDLTGGDAERATVYTYDPLGRPETVTDPEGGVVRQAWNTLGQLVRVTDPRGTVIENGYTERGQLHTRTLKGWTGSPVNPQPAKDVLLESYSYDAAGRLAAQVDAMGRKTSFEYFSDNLPAKKIADDVKLNGSTTPRDVVLEDNTYDAAGNRTRLVTGGGTATTEFVYDAAARLTSQTFDPGALNRKIAFVYDANGNVLKTTLTGAGTTRSEVTEYAYNKVNQVTRTTVEDGDADVVTTSTYDDRGLAVAATDPRGNAAGADKDAFTSTMRYDALGRLIEATGPQVKVDKAGNSATARPSARFGYDTVGARTHETDPEGRTITSVFDKAGRLTGKSAPAYTPPGGTAITPTTAHAYDPAGLLTTTTDPRGYTSTFEYDQLGRQVRVTDPAPEGQTAGRWVAEYDLAGEQLAAVDPTGARAEATYDDLGRKITTTQVERKPSAAAYTTTYTYTDGGHLTKTIAPGNRTTTIKVNAAGEATEQTDPATNTTKMAYDPAGRVAKVTDPLGNASVAEYDLAGRKIAVKDLNASGTVLRTTGAGYDLAGNQISSTSGEGHETKQTFDPLGRLTSLIEPVKTGESITTSFGYDAAGARTRLTDGRGNATWTTYNTLGLPETVVEPATTAHPDAADRTWTAAYDAAGNPTALIQPGGVRIDRTFDHLGRLTKETGGGGEAASAERTFGYDLASRQTTIGDLTVDYNDRTLPLAVKRGTSTQTSYAYDGLGNPTQRTDAAGTATFTWDSAGRLETATDPVTTRKITYGYDAASRLKSMNAATGTTASDSQLFTYDDLDRLETHTLKTGAGAQLAKITYGWDKDDNLTTKTTAGTAGAGTNTYTYDHAGRLTSWQAPGGTTTPYEWDASGNRTKAGDKTYTYDERNRLTSGDGTDYTYTPRGTLATQTKNGTTTQLTYDAFDRLIADGDSLYSYDALDRVTTRTRGTTKQLFAYAGLGNDLAAITDTNGGVQAKYGRDPFGGLLGQQEGTNPALATLTDLHGDLIATFTGTALATTTAYDPFGAVTAQTGAKTNLGYQGEYTDPDTGKVNMHARWYQPGTGTFTSRDTATLTPNPSVQANRYTYANASPLTGIDPTGHYTDHLSRIGGPEYDLSRDPQEVAESYASLGIISGGGGGSEMCTFGRNCASSSGSGSTVEICGACILAHQLVWGTVSIMTEEEMKRWGHLPNGWPTPPGFWELGEEARQDIIDLAYDGASPQMLNSLWRDMKKAVAAGGKSVSRQEIQRAMSQNAKLGWNLQKCHSHLDNKECRKLIEEEWEGWRKLFCGNSKYTTSCTATPVAKLVAKATDIPVKLFEFLGTQPPWITLADFSHRAVSWAQKHGATCNPRGILVVCTGLKSGVHYGREATTIGNVVLTGEKPGPAFLNHEAEHARQWDWYYRRTGFWPTFLVYYLDSSIIDECKNVYERQAEAVSKTYDCKK